MLGVTVPDDEAMIAIDYDSYFLKLSCFEALGGVSGQSFENILNDLDTILKQEHFTFN